MAVWYLDEDLTTGLNDGSSWASAYQTWADAVTGVGTLTEDSTLNIRSNGSVSLERAMSGIDISTFTLEIVLESGSVLSMTSGYAPAFITNFAGSGTVELRNFRITHAGNSYGIRLLHALGAVDIFNPIITSSGTARRCIYGTHSATANIYDGIFVNTIDGIGNTQSGTINAYNCYADGTSNGYVDSGSGTLNLTTCASSDLTGSVGLQSVPYDNTTFVSITSGSEDFKPADGSSLIGVGTVTVNTLDFNGDERGTPRDIGAVTYTVASKAVSPVGITLGAIVLPTPTAGLPVVDFSYADINAGFSGFFNFVDDPNERKFGRNALWFGKIKGTDATLNVAGSTSSNPYVVYVDGVQSTPTKSADRITLFSGLPDSEHTVCIIGKTSAINLFNAIPTTSTDAIIVTGANPTITNLPMDYVSDPTFKGVQTFGMAPTGVADLTPEYEEVIQKDYESGQIIIDAQCDELWIYTDALGCWYTIDGGAPVEVTFSEVNQESGQTVRRAVQVATGLDNTQNHRYRIWCTVDPVYGHQGVVALSNGSPIALNQTPSLKRALLFGSSVVDGLAGATEGESDAWLVGNSLDIAITKAGKGGNTTPQSESEIPTIMAATGVPEIAIFGSSTNDSGSSPTLQTEYESLINTLLTQGVTTVICRGVVPYFSGQHDKLEAAVQAVANPNVHFVSSQTWSPIETTDGTHPTALGYQQLAAFETPEFDAIINIGASPDNLVLSSILLDSPSVSATVKTEDLVLSSLILGQTAQTGKIDLGIITTSGIITDKFATTGRL